jgi:ubiquinone/menaquinone biosynthesis C-methylase UbiE
MATKAAAKKTSKSGRAAKRASALKAPPPKSPKKPAPAPRTPGSKAPTGAAAPVTPERIMDVMWGFAGARALDAAVELGVFTEIAAGHATVASLSNATKSSPRAIRMLLDSLVALGLVRRASSAADAVHTLAPDAALFLVSTGPAYLGEFLRFHSSHIDESWRRLSECIRTGRPVMAVDKPAEGVPLWHALVDSLFNLNWRAGTQVGEELAKRHPGKEVHLLDVASGSGVWGLAAATANPRIRVTSFDLAETLAHARRNTARSAAASRVDFLEGDLRSTDLGEGRYDAAFLGHILHSEGEAHSKALLSKVAKALRPGGTIGIAEFTPDADRAGPVIPVLFSLNMLVHTSDGDTYTFPQVRSWLEGAGFRDVRQVPAASVSPLIYATRA